MIQSMPFFDSTPQEETMKAKKLYFVFLLLLILACRMPNLINGPSQAEPTAPKKPAFVILSSSPTSETITDPTPESETECKVKTGIETGLLNLRDGPSMSYKPLKVLNEGDPITLTDKPAENGWLYVKAHSLQGWVNQKYILCKEVNNP